MSITIVTVTYNSANSLMTCLKSVMEQDYPDLEYVLIDGDSKDHTQSIIRDMQRENTNIRFISEPDMGIYDALNKGVAMARGDVIGFVHSDDFLADSSIISSVIRQFQQENTDGVYGDLHYVGQEKTDNVIRFWKSRPFNTRLLRQGWMPAHPTFFLKKEVYMKHGKFDLSYKIAADYDFMLRVLSDDTLRFSYLPQVITKMRIGGVSNRSVKNLFQKSREDYRAIKSNGLPHPLRTLFLKNISKIPQFLKGF